LTNENPSRQAEDYSPRVNDTLSKARIRQMPFKLPPLGAVRVFEVAARTGSFKAAAEELNITASAVSHAVQNLEDWLGIELFRRNRGKLVLTEPGIVYAAAAGESIKTLSEATARVPGRRSRGRLVIDSAPAFAARWLIPRLNRFIEKHPDIAIDIKSSLDYVDLPMEGLDAAIRMATQSQAMAHWTKLFAETLVPICSPALKRKFEGLSKEELVATAPLIHLSSVSADWEEWLRLSDIEQSPRWLPGLRVDTIHLALEAASYGLGVAIGRGPFLELEMRSRQLVRLFDGDVASGRSYWLVPLEPDFQSQDVKAFRKWVLEEIQTAQPKQMTPAGRASNRMRS
jgi:LysR family glycine cleavage system transcriptional activator